MKLAIIGILVGAAIAGVGSLQAITTSSNHQSSNHSSSNAPAPTETRAIAANTIASTSEQVSNQSNTTQAKSTITTPAIADPSLYSSNRDRRTTARTLPSAMIAQGSMAAEIIAAHNRYRSELGLSDLKWSERLSGNAQEWASHLASKGGNTLEHSRNSGEGENLWLGTTGAFSYQQMVDGWGDEKQYFKAGQFPDVSTTGNWSDVGHYTQIIWRDTTEVGCATASAGGNDILVCRYSPPGNFMGQSVY
jgi:uncharacterized protein YkwD